MPTTLVRRKILFFLLVAVLVASWPSSAAGGQRDLVSVRSGELAVPELFNRIWSFLRGVEGKIGCNIDPNGCCAPAQSSEPPRKEGCNIDPDGRCAAILQSQPPQPKIGCNIDPDGRCIS